MLDLRFNLDTHWRLYMIIKSRPRNFERRETIRKTWASVRFLDGGKFDHVFLMGREKPGQTSLLKKEYEKYGDILQYDEADAIRWVVSKTQKVSD